MTTQPPVDQETQDQSAPEGDEQVTVSKKELETLRGQVKERDTLTGQYKNLQRELNKARQNGQNTTALQGQLTSVHHQLAAIMEAFSASDLVPPEMKEKLGKSQQQAVAESTTGRLQGVWQETVSQALEDNELEWEAPELAKARDLWDKGMYLPALNEVNRAGRDALKKSSTKEQTVTDQKATPGGADVATQVREELKKAGVRTADTKESSVPKRGKVTRQDLADLSPEGLTTRQLVEQQQKQYDAFYGAKG